MATPFNGNYPRATARGGKVSVFSRQFKDPRFLFTRGAEGHSSSTRVSQLGSLRAAKIKVSNDRDSYLDMWRSAMERERKSLEFQRIAEKSAGGSDGEEEEEVGEIGRESSEGLERKNNEFKKILEVSAEERDRVQRMQVIDRAAAAIAAARALLKENPVLQEDSLEVKYDAYGNSEDEQVEGKHYDSSPVAQSITTSSGTPGPDFWSWTPPSDIDGSYEDDGIKTSGKISPKPIISIPLIEKERSVDYLTIPFESSLALSKHSSSLPPLESLTEVENSEETSFKLETPHWEEERQLGVQFSAHAAEAADALNDISEALTDGVNPDGTRWWKETGIEQRPDGVVCRWTLTRGVTADRFIEWEEKYWEASDELGYKELGSEKSGRDAAGNVWREYWRESMSQNQGVVNLEKTADKWGRNGKGEEWQEKWWEHYGPSGLAEKWADKWCSIDPNTVLEAGHAHVWHERWGEKYDGQGGSTKYTDKWAERCEGDGWAKWGDKWDEHFDPNGHGVKQGETWWEGKYGERWNRTWGEQHNGSGWVHKYGRSSSGEHWDTHVEQETWYERFPHYGFYHCFENSVQLREVKKPSEWNHLNGHGEVKKPYEWS